MIVDWLTKEGKRDWKRGLVEEVGERGWLEVEKRLADKYSLIELDL